MHILITSDTWSVRGCFCTYACFHTAYTWTKLSCSVPVLGCPSSSCAWIASLIFKKHVLFSSEPGSLSHLWDGTSAWDLKWNDLALSDQFAVSSPHHNTSTHNSAGFGRLLRRELGLHLQEHWIISSLWRWQVGKDSSRSGLRPQKEANNEAAKFYFSMLGIQRFFKVKTVKVKRPIFSKTHDHRI